MSEFGDLVDNLIKTELEKRGYNVSYKVIDSRYYNSPQSRHRIYIICNKDKNYQFREVNNTIIPVSSIIDPDINDYFDYKEKYKLEKCDGKYMMKYKLINKKTCYVQMEGGELKIEYKKNGHIVMTGPIKTIKKGVLNNFF